MSLFNLIVAKTIMHVPGPVVSLFARNYIAGTSLDDAVSVTRDLNRQGIMATIDVLGEFIRNREEALAFKKECLAILDRIQEEGLDANLSLKPTQLGLLLDRDFADTNLEEIVAHAKRLNNFVRFDMEDLACTNGTLASFRRLRESYSGHLGTALQAYLRRTPADIEALADGYLNVRLCKGIYDEPREAAWKDPAIIVRSFVSCLERLLQKGAYVGIATHDERVIFEALRLIAQYGLKREEYEFQMLLGVDEELRRMLVSQGHRLRVYVPFGTDWLPYCRRRLKENPAIARHALRQLFGLHGQAGNS
jgi:proline dehydrogenase